MSGIVTAAHVHEPDDVEISLTIRMSVKNWRSVMEALPSDYGRYWYPAHFRDQIHSVIHDVAYKALKIDRPDTSTATEGQSE